MRVLLYEFATGGGLYGTTSSALPIRSLLCEGKAMVTALAHDFLQIPNVHVIMLWDHRLRSSAPTECVIEDIHSAAEERDRLARLAARCDWTVLIAPECNQELLRRCQLVERCGGRLLSPGASVVQWTSDKHQTSSRLEAAGVPVPRSYLLQRGETVPPAFPFPAVLKPCDGAGSMGMRRVDSAGELAEAEWFGERMCLERYCAGTAASVSLLLGPADSLVLPPCRQHLSGDGRLSYLGGTLLWDRPLRCRAITLARKVARLLEGAIGYAGTDMILRADNEPDIVIEINPRLTTSYIGLRATVRENLALAMLGVAEGKVPRLSYHRREVQFWPDGRVQMVK